MIHRIIHDRKLVLSVAPRAGHHTVTGLIDAISSEDGGRQSWRSDEDIVRRHDFFKIKFVRNPYHRAVSSYYVLCGNPVLALYTHCFGLSQEEAFRLTFRDFLKLLKRKNLNFLDHHLGPQKSAGEGIALQYDAVIKIETLLRDMEKICAKLGISLVRPVKWENFARKVKSRGKYYDVPFGELWRRFPGKSMPEYGSFYDEEIQKMVFELFTEDITSNGYDLKPKVFEGIAKCFKKERPEGDFSPRDFKKKSENSISRKSPVGDRRQERTGAWGFAQGFAKNLLGAGTVFSKIFLEVAEAVLKRVKILPKGPWHYREKDHFAAAYLGLYPELKKHWNSPLKARLHWIFFGKKEGRRIKPREQLSRSKDLSASQRTI